MSAETIPGRVPEAINCYQCGTPIDLAGQSAFAHVDCGRCGAISVVPLQFGNFLLLNSLGVGGMGTVYKAIDLSLNRNLALKILRHKLAVKAEFIQSFSREARAAAAVNHPNIAQVYSFGEHQGQYYLAMELLERGSLDDRMSTLGKIPEKDVLEIGLQVAAGLRAAEQRGLLHRDVKPGNILFNDDGTPKIVDFGLARASNEAQASNEPVWGTPYYIAPEKLRGQPEDVRSDIYSLGATLYHALAGRPPFEAETASEVVTKHTTQPAYSLKTYVPQIQPSTANVIGRMLAKNPADRFQTYETLIHQLGEASAAYTEAQAQRTVVSAKGERIPLRSVVATLAAVVLAVIAVIFVWVNRVSIFHLEQQQPTAQGQPGFDRAPTAPPPPGFDSSQPIDFAGDDPWINSWNKALHDLAAGRYQAAYQNLATASRLAGPARVKVRQWIKFYEGLALLAEGHTNMALATFVGASDPNAPRAVPETVTTANFVDCLALLMIDELPPAALEEAVPRLPDWAVALADLALGFKDLQNLRFTDAIPRLRAYEAREPSPAHTWAYALQPLAKRLANQCTQALQMADQVEQLLAQKGPESAQRRLDQALKTIPDGPWRSVLEAQQPGLQTALAALEQERAREREEQEKRRAEQEARERAQADAELRLAETVEPQVASFFQKYDFAGARDAYRGLQNQFTTPTARRAMQQRLAVAEQLITFRQQLIADINRPSGYPGRSLRTRDNRTVTGQLQRANDSELSFGTQYGEFVHGWTDFAPAELLKMATACARAFAADEDPSTQAQRYLGMAVFARRYGLDEMAEKLVGEALRRDPSLPGRLEQLGFAGAN